MPPNAISRGKKRAGADTRVSRFLLYLFAFGLYTITLLLLTGRTFAWDETRKTFYLGGMKFGTLMSLATFCATWMSAASLVGFTVWVMQDGYIAFAGSVHGWLLGLLPMPLLVYRLRKRHAISVPEWMASEYGDDKLRYLGGATLLFAYLLYLVIQFRAFGEIASYMLQIPVGFYAAALVYLFVLYTTFGGYPSVVRSDALNICLILAGVSIALFAAVRIYGSPVAAHRLLAREAPEMLSSWRSWNDGLVTLTLALSWGFGVASNPQYSVRLMAARTSASAMRSILGAACVVGWVYFAITNLGIVSAAFLPSGISLPADTSGFAAFFDRLLPAWASLPLLIAVLAAAVSTANSELLVATCALCYDLNPQPRGVKDDPLSEFRFLFYNRIAIVVIASLSLLLSQMSLPGILAIGRISWTMLAVCFFFPLYFDLRGRGGRSGIFRILCASVFCHLLFFFATPISAEVSMLIQLALQGVAFFVCLSPEAGRA